MFSMMVMVAACIRGRGPGPAGGRTWSECIISDCIEGSPIVVQHAMFLTYIDVAHETLCTSRLVDIINVLMAERLRR